MTPTNGVGGGGGGAPYGGGGLEGVVGVPTDAKKGASAERRAPHTPQETASAAISAPHSRQSISHLVTEHAPDPRHRPGRTYEVGRSSSRLELLINANVGEGARDFKENAQERRVAFPDTVALHAS